MSEREYVQWCRDLFNALVDGGTWAVPRSGLIFNREGDKLVLVEQMAEVPGVPLRRAKLLRYQQQDFEVIASYFREAGITVERRAPHLRAAQ